MAMSEGGAAASPIVLGMSVRDRGLTKREHFAIEILAGIAHGSPVYAPNNPEAEGIRREQARVAVLYADALLMELSPEVLHKEGR